MRFSSVVKKKLQSCILSTSEFGTIKKEMCMAKKVSNMTASSKFESVRGKNSKKVVHVKSKTTRSGIDSCRSDERTLKLYEATATRSSRLNRLMRKAGISSSKRLSEITGMPPGAMGRMIRGDSCLSTAGCFQVQYGLWNNMATGVLTEGEDNMSTNKKLYIRPGYLLGFDDTEPMVVTNESVKIIDLLKDIFGQYDGLVGSCIQGLIPGNNNLSDTLEKRAFALFVGIDTFRAMYNDTFVSFIGDDTIMVCIDRSSNKESLNEKICVIQRNPESSMVARKVFLQDKFMIFRSINGGDHGAFVLEMEEEIHRIGEVILTIHNVHKEIMETAMRLNGMSEKNHATVHSRSSRYDEKIIYPNMSAESDSDNDSFTLTDVKS